VTEFALLAVPKATGAGAVTMGATGAGDGTLTIRGGDSASGAGDGAISGGASAES